MVQVEQKDFMKCMTKPEMVAENFALLENVLVILASKSLVVHLVSQSLCGYDSGDLYLKTLPQVYLVHHQGSSSSTSDGIVIVFNKAHNYQKENSKEFPLITVVLLDVKPNYPTELSKVAIIGISN
ncbi:hypothetical protein C2G38_2163578 [Gigaspora rosea]|uniref:Uncharacterized protein n=1 Tax=Gigaspora rosea TaxID=44941 RepID=A0A397VUY2_9GLOM|nr:hypothetical protein C2G38_2163578 [Gigaspora rosea]